jgi:hypothetical protein
MRLESRAKEYTYLRGMYLYMICIKTPRGINAIYVYECVHVYNVRERHDGKALIL